MCVSVSSVIIIAGPPASGKTVLSRKIADTFMLPLISKDDIKIELYEYLKDIIGIEDRLISRASYNMLFYLFKSFVKSGTNFVVESNFDLNESVDNIRKIRKEFRFDSLTILCNADINILYERFLKRDKSSERSSSLVCEKYHSFKAFCTRQDELKSHLFDIGDKRVLYDSTEFHDTKLKRIMDEIGMFLNQQNDGR